MTALSPITKRVDHIMIRVIDSTYDQLFSLLTKTLQLPISWPVNDYIPSFKTGGVFAGNISMEIFHSGTQQVLPSPEPSQAQLYGIAFEPFSLAASLQELDNRGTPHSPLIPVPQGTPGTMGGMWTLLFLRNLLGCDMAQDGSSREPGNEGNLTPVFDGAFANGMAFFCEYTPSFYDTTQGRIKRQAELRARQGGPLGLEGVQEIVVGARDFETALGSWQELFAPIVPLQSGLWQIGDGPAIRLVPHHQDGLVTLIWKVASLERARMFLSEQDMLGKCTKGQVSLEQVFGLDIRLVERWDMLS